ncbi:MAG: hypothetical protein PHV77_00890 [Candidatus Omnitrophica bacterium]|nr:hypothetical protein [Candidatus Omnitrophota bacterium]
MKNNILNCFIAASLCLALCRPIALWADGLPAGGVFKVSYQCRDTKGNPRWSAVTDILFSPESEKGVNKIIESGSGIYSGFKDKISWISELRYIDTGSSVKPLNSFTKIFDLSGRLISTEEQVFDFNKNKAFFTRCDTVTGKTSRQEFNFNGDVVNRLILALYVQQFLKTGQESAKVEMLSSEPRLIKCGLYIIGKEEIETGGARTMAYKLCLDPQLGLFNFVKVLIPKAYVWHSAEPDFEWLRYRGLEINLDSPIVEIEKERNQK